MEVLFYLNGCILGVYLKVIVLFGGFNFGVKRLTVVEVIKEINFIGIKYEEDFLFNLFVWYGFLNRKYDLEYVYVVIFLSL